MKSNKKWFIVTLLGTIISLAVILVVMIIVDPYFHYHGKISGISYRIYYERYINDGIAKHFDYDAIITGTSMNQNFKATKMNELFDVNTVKMTYSGGGFQEIADNLEVALNSGNQVKYVLWGLDYHALSRVYDWKAYTDYPEYLYDDNIWNDVSYFWNKSILFEGLFTNLLMTLKGEPTTTFDEYSAWDNGYGWEVISKTYQRSDEIKPMEEEMTEREKERTTENIMENIVKLVNQYPDTEFLFFYTPYSVYFWESIYRDGTLNKQLEAEKIATELLLQCENVTLFNFHSETDITGNDEKYCDKEHYIGEINDLILEWIVQGKGLVTENNYLDMIQWQKEYYTNYNYDSLYKNT